VLHGSPCCPQMKLLGEGLPAPEKGGYEDCPAGLTAHARGRIAGVGEQCLMQGGRGGRVMRIVPGSSAQAAWQFDAEGWWLLGQGRERDEQGRGTLANFGGIANLKAMLAKRPHGVRVASRRRPARLRPCKPGLAAGRRQHLAMRGVVPARRATVERLVAFRCGCGESAPSASSQPPVPWRRSP